AFVEDVAIAARPAAAGRRRRRHHRYLDTAGDRRPHARQRRHGDALGGVATASISGLAPASSWTIGAMAQRSFRTSPTSDCQRARAAQRSEAVMPLAEFVGLCAPLPSVVTSIETHLKILCPMRLCRCSRGLGY